MKHVSRGLTLTASVALDITIIAFCAACAYILRFDVFLGINPVLSFSSHVLISVLFSPVYILLYSLLGIYDYHPRGSNVRVMGRLTIANTIATMIYIVMAYMFRIENLSRWLIVVSWVLVCSLTCVKVLLVNRIRRHLYTRGFDKTSVVVIGDGQTAFAYCQSVADQQTSRHKVLGSVGAQQLGKTCPLLGSFTQLPDILNQIKPDQVVIALDADRNYLLNHIIVQCEAMGISVALLPDFYDLISSRPFISQQAGLPLIDMNRIALDNMGNAFVKRAIDLVGSAILIVLTSPLMLIAAIFTKTSSPGPIIFKQERIGRGRQPFYMYKFRSMCLNDSSEVAWTDKGDPRRTKWGTFMRRYSIDELPQLFNVFKGEMSLVGPRPEIPYHVENFKLSVPLYLVRHRVRPGMTGWAQVNGLRGNTSIEKRVEYDLFYIENWSLLFDIRILLLTPTRGIINRQE